MNWGMIQCSPEANSGSVEEVQTRESHLPCARQLQICLKDKSRYSIAYRGKVWPSQLCENSLIHKPSLAWELNQDGFSAMSLASENGHIAVVKELLACDPLLYKLKDRDGRTLLHCAAIHGRLEILHELLTSFVDCVGQVTVRGETALHLALKNKDSCIGRTSQATQS
ncbi:hypothetical protein LWI29_023695 [Acer saccharum]|uniref:Uncharacterized protein n=1 Tax=Acer saccharum TaxID=4024 RepID=A0AA39S0H9_ACESA|nr:hypothetical protein LWI29_023695 [Acer saccharum]